MEASDTAHLRPVSVVIYTRRWYILAVFSLMAMVQCTVWNTWGPIEETVKLVFQWTDKTVALFANWGTISFLVFLAPCLYLMEINLRLSVVLTGVLLAVSTSLRCLYLPFPRLSNYTFTYLSHAAAILNGIAGIIVCSAPPAVSAAWFPIHERVTATSIGQLLNSLGGGLSFIIASSFVKESTSSNNSCSPPNTSFYINITQDDIPTLKTQIQYYMYSLAVPCLVLCACSLVYFPSEPPTPPSRSSTQARAGFLSGCRQILINPAAWAIALVWAVPQAIVQTWAAMMVVNLTKIGYNGVCLSESWVNELAIVAGFVGTGIAILVAKGTDRMRGHMKTTVMVLLFLATIVYVLLTLISVKVIIFTKMLYLEISIYVLLLTGFSLSISTSPLCVELAVEKLYPVAEGVVGGWLNIWYNLIAMTFLFLFDIPHIGTAWLNYVLPLSTAIVLPLMAWFKEEHRRSGVDEGEGREGDEGDDSGDEELGDERDRMVDV